MKENNILKIKIVGKEIKKSRGGLTNLLNAFGAQDLESFLSAKENLTKLNKIKFWISGLAKRRGLPNTKEVGEECIQDVMVTLLKDTFSYEQREGTDPWDFIITMARRQLLSRVRQHNKKIITEENIDEYSDPENEDNLDTDNLDILTDPKETALEEMVNAEVEGERQQIVKRIYEIIENMNEEYRRILQVTYPNGIGNKKVSAKIAAKELNLSPDAYAYRLRRAKETIKQNLRAK